MKIKGKEILSKFLAEEKISNDEMSRLKDWLSNDQEIEQVLLEEWEKGDEKETSVQFTGIKNSIKERESFSREDSFLRKILINYQKIAALILLPVIAVSVYLGLHQFGSETEWFQTTAERGHKSKLELPDGTRVWLNSDSRLEYPQNFGKKTRTVFLTGEAYFEVNKNSKKPFLVETRQSRVKVLGTSFNISAYPNEPDIETTLFEGKVELTVIPDNNKTLPRTLEMRPGESIIFNTIKNQLKYNNFENDEVRGWTNNQLIFRNDSFEKLVRKIERWYNVEVIYDEASLNNQRLTVELYQGELLNRLLGIIELTMNVECISENDKIYIKAKE